MLTLEEGRGAHETMDDDLIPVRRSDLELILALVAGYLEEWWDGFKGVPGAKEFYDQRQNEVNRLRAYLAPALEPGVERHPVTGVPITHDGDYEVT